MNIEQRQDFERGLEIIEARSASLNRFLQAYRQLAQMPPPALRRVALSPIVERVVFLETRLTVTMLRGPDITLMVDPDQIEQMLINLVRNAADAVLETPSNSENAALVASTSESENVKLHWDTNADDVILTIDDNGPGLSNPSNVFTPFYTTKPNGSGVGLVLSRQIAEAHGGSIELANRNGSGGCQVRVLLPSSQR